MTRPQLLDRQRVEDIATQLAPRFGVQPNDREAIADVVEVSLNSPYEDEYRKARALEGRGWDCDRSTLEAFEALDDQLRMAHRAAVRSWVAQCNIQPHLEVGAAVEVVRQRKPHAGVIVEINPTDACYLVRIPEQGHVPSGQNGVQGWRVPFEELHDIVADPSDFRLTAPPGEL